MTLPGAFGDKTISTEILKKSVVYLMSKNLHWFADFAVIGPICCSNTANHEPLVTEQAHANAIPLARFCDCMLQYLARHHWVTFAAERSCFATKVSVQILVGIADR